MRVLHNSSKIIMEVGLEDRQEIEDDHRIRVAIIKEGKEASIQGDQMEANLKIMFHNIKMSLTVITIKATTIRMTGMESLINIRIMALKNIMMIIEVEEDLHLNMITDNNYRREVVK